LIAGSREGRRIVWSGGRRFGASGSAQAVDDRSDLASLPLHKTRRIARRDAVVVLPAVLRSGCGRPAPSRKRNPLRLETKFLSNLKLIWAVQTAKQKIFCFSEQPIRSITRLSPRLLEGR
jgi:hypothetical protein